MARGMHKGIVMKEWNSDMIGSNGEKRKDRTTTSNLDRRRSAYHEGQPAGSTHRPGSNKK